MKQLVAIILCLALLGCGTKGSQNGGADTLSTDSVKSIPTDTVANKKDAEVKEVTRFNDDGSYLKLDSYLVNTKLDKADFQKIDSSCAILISPTNEQIELMEKEYGEDLIAISDDNVFYQSLAMNILDSLGIATITASEKRYIKLIDNDMQEWILDIRQKGAPGWNLIFFNVNKKPKVVSAINVNSELILDYFDEPLDQER